MTRDRLPLRTLHDIYIFPYRIKNLRALPALIHVGHILCCIIDIQYEHVRRFNIRLQLHYFLKFQLPLADNPGNAALADG